MSDRQTDSGWEGRRGGQCGDALQTPVSALTKRFISPAEGRLRRLKLLL